MSDALLDGLNPEQRKAVTLPDQNALVLAGAGSGKTRVLASRIAWLIREGRAKPWSILAVTFTNKAAREMLNRVSQMMPVDTRGMWVGTFHGLCNRMLRVHHTEAGLPSGFQIIDQADQLSLVKRVMKASGISAETIEPRDAQNFINRNKEKGVRAAGAAPAASFYPRERAAHEVYKRYEETCFREGGVDFAELLLRCCELLQRNALVRREYQKRFSHILVDEFQDTNVLQYKWLKILAGYGEDGSREADGGCVFAVGDDDQSIYSFRGANVGNMGDFTRELGVDGIVRLEQNYRSTGCILKAANALIGNNRKRLGKNLWTSAGEGEKITVVPTDTAEGEARFVASTVAARHRRGAAYSDFAVLYRSNAQSRALESAFMAEGIPYRIYGGHRFFERAHVKDVLAYLRLIDNPDDNTAFLRAVNMPPRKIGAKTIEDLEAAASSAGTSLFEAAASRPGTRTGDFAGLIDGLRQAASGMSLTDCVKEVIKRSTLDVYYAEVDRKEHSAKSEDLKEVVSAAAVYLRNAGLGADAGALDTASDDELSPLASFLALSTLEAGDNKPDGTADAAQMMTVHSAKGLEFPEVFITGLEENLFPHGSALRDAPETGLEEERRLMYVAITRAKRRLTLSYASERFINGYTQQQIQSSFIDEIPGEFLQRLGKKRKPGGSGYQRSGSYGGYGGRGGCGGPRGEGRYGSGGGFGDEDRYGSSRGEGRYGRSRDDDYFRPPKDEPLLKKRQASQGGWKAGDKVKHAKFGRGTVVATVGSGDMLKLQIAFFGQGVKVLLAKVAKLEKI